MMSDAELELVIARNSCRLPTPPIQLEVFKWGVQMCVDRVDTLKKELNSIAQELELHAGGVVEIEGKAGEDNRHLRLLKSNLESLVNEMRGLADEI